MLRNNWFVLGIVTAIACLTSACSRESYGLVATLGKDTISIERITRTGSRVVSEVAERSPRAMRKTWEARLNDDGTVERFTMETRLLNPAPSEAAVIHTTIEFGADSIRTTEQTGSSTKRVAVPNEPHVNAPWNPYVYGTYELLFGAAANVPGDSVRVHQFIPGYGRGHGVVRKQPDGTLTFVSTRLSGTGIGKVNEQGRLLSYDGRNTTYKQLVERIDQVGDIDAIASRFTELERASPGGWLSARDTTLATVGAAAITIEYSRPLVRGRTILGDLVPYDRIWRTGANAATHLTTTAPISIAGIDLAAGTYTVWTLPTRDSVMLIVNRQTGQWGTGYRAAHDIGRIRMAVDSLPEVTEAFTINVESGMLIFEWDHFRWSAPLRSR